MAAMAIVAVSRPGRRSASQCSSLTMKFKDGAWQVTAIGNAAEAVTIGGIKGSVRDNPLGSFFLVRIADLFAFFLGYYREDGELTMVAINKMVFSTDVEEPEMKGD